MALWRRGPPGLEVLGGIVLRVESAMVLHGERGRGDTALESLGSGRIYPHGALGPWSFGVGDHRIDLAGELERRATEPGEHGVGPRSPGGEPLDILGRDVSAPFSGRLGWACPTQPDRPFFFSFASPLVARRWGRGV